MIVSAEADEGTDGWTVDYFTFLISLKKPPPHRLTSIRVVPIKTRKGETCNERHDEARQEH
jgi:hypothetical protein